MWKIWTGKKPASNPGPLRKATVFNESEGKGLIGKGGYQWYGWLPLGEGIKGLWLSRGVRSFIVKKKKQQLAEKVKRVWESKTGSGEK